MNDENTIAVNMHEAKTHLSQYVDMANQGKTVFLCRRNIPIAEITPIKKRGKRRLGSYKPGSMIMQSTFDDPLPPSIAAGFGIDTGSS